MSVALFRDSYNDIYNLNSKIDLCIPISSERFYIKYWELAIKELNIKFIKDGAEFKKIHLDNVILELNLLEEWAIKNLKCLNLEYIQNSIKVLKEEIPNAFIDDDTILHIF